MPRFGFGVEENFDAFFILHLECIINLKYELTAFYFSKKMNP